MQTTDNQNVSEPLRLTPQQQRVLEALIDRETEEYPLGRWYLGALYALNNEQNPDRIAQTAHSLRELVEKLPRVVLGIGVQANTSGLAGVRRGIYDRILKDKKRYAKGWKGGTINAHLDKTLRKIEDYLDRNQQPTRKEKIQMAVAVLDPMGNRFDRQTQEKKRDEFNSLWKRLENFAHHKTYSNPEEFGACLKDIERAVFDLLAPITAENQKEIQTILGNANRSETDVENMFSLIERRGANYVFFFKHAAENADTAWLSHLDKRGYFTNLPNVEPIGNDRVNFPFSWPMHYLARMAQCASEDVIETVLRLPKTDNPWIYNEILEIALQLPGTHSVKLQPKILEYVNLEHHVLSNRFAYVLARWTDENQTDAALKLAKAFVNFVSDPQDKAKRKRREEEPTDLNAQLATLADTRLEPSPRFDDFAYRKIMSEGVRPLVAKEPYRVACVLIDATAKMIRLRTHQADVNKDFDDSELWFERLTRFEDSYENAEKSLVHTLTFACQQVYEKVPNSVPDLDNALRGQPWRIFKRLRQHLFAQYPTETTKLWIQELIREYENYSQWEYGYEFQQMIRSACEHFGNALLTKIELKQIFDCIRNGPSKDGLTKDEIRQHQRRFHRIQFRPFATVLFGEYKTYFQELEDEAVALVSDEDYQPLKTRAGYVSTRSPRTSEDLANLTDEKLLSFINEWDEKEDVFEGNNLVEVNIQGLSRAFQAVFREKIISAPKRHKFWMEYYHKIERPVFVERMIDVLRERVEANNFDNLDEWLTFGGWVLSHPDDSEHGIYNRHAGESRDDPNWSNSRWTTGDFIASCFRKDVNPPVSARAQFVILLDMFCTQFDWRLDQHLTENKPVDTSMNTPRCRALEALVGFGLWLRRNDGGSDVSEVMAILEKRLAPTAKYPLTPPEYAILGKNYNRLFYLNEAWSAAHKSVLFPRDEFPNWLASFDSFVGFNSPFKPTYEILQDDFHFALEHLPDIKKQDRPEDKLIDMLGQRLFIYYLWELYPLRGEESLLEQYYQASDDDREQWANLFDYVGHLLWDANGQLDENVKGKIIDFFEWRFEVREQVELQQFTYWLKAECLDARWRLNAYFKVLDTLKTEDMSIAIQIDALCEMLPHYTAEVVACFTKLTDRIRDNTIDIYTEEAKTILKAGIESSNENVRRDAARAHENLLRTGRFDLETLADELSDKFMEFVGPDSPPLSDHAVTREAMYEDDV